MLSWNSFYWHSSNPLFGVAVFILKLIDWLKFSENIGRFKFAKIPQSCIKNCFYWARNMITWDQGHFIQTFRTYKCISKSTKDKQKILCYLVYLWLYFNIKGTKAKVVLKSMPFCRALRPWPKHEGHDLHGLCLFPSLLLTFKVYNNKSF